jgi:DNA invertase Pin-like site-specific DNA recombinase
MLVGFARLSEYEPEADLAAQRRALAAAGVEKVFVGASTLKGRQPAREAALSFMREGDCLVVARPDRIARTPGEMLKLADGLARRGIGFVVLSGFGPTLDTRDRSSAPLLNALRGVAAWAKADRRELQRAGIERTRRADPDKYARAGKTRVSAGAIQALAADGFGPTRIAAILRINRGSVYRYLPEGYRVTPKPKRVPRERLDTRTIKTLLAAGVGPSKVAASLGCSQSSVRRLSSV